jgi:hypothetical protein
LSGAPAKRRSFGSKPTARLWCGALLCASVFLTRARAHAEGAPPTVSQLLVDPSDERHLALRSSFGLLVSRDAGTSWDWRCKAAMWYKGNAEPAVAILNGGALVIGAAAGITTGDAAGCDFKPASGIAGRVADVVAIPDTPGAAVAVSVSFADSSSRVWQSLDNGRSFQARSAAFPHFTALSLGVPRSLSRASRTATRELSRTLQPSIPSDQTRCICASPGYPGRSESATTPVTRFAKSRPFLGQCKGLRSLRMASSSF